MASVQWDCSNGSSYSFAEVFIRSDHNIQKLNCYTQTFFPQHPALSHCSPGRADGAEQKSLWSVCGLFSKRTYLAHFPWFIFQDCSINLCQTRFILNQELQKGLSFVLMPSMRTPTSHIYRVTLNLRSIVLSLSRISIFKRYKWFGIALSQRLLQAVSKSGSSTLLKSQWLPEMSEGSPETLHHFPSYFSYPAEKMLSNLLLLATTPMEPAVFSDVGK